MAVFPVILGVVGPTGQEEQWQVTPEVCVHASVQMISAHWSRDLLGKKGCAPSEWRSFRSLKRYSTWHRSVEWHMVWPKQKHKTLPRVPLSLSSNINWVSCYPEYWHDTIDKATCKLMMEPVWKNKKAQYKYEKWQRQMMPETHTCTTDIHQDRKGHTFSKTWVSHLPDTLTVQPSVGI